MVMLIDDDKDDCDIFCDAAQQVVDCKCHCVHTCNEALSILSRAEVRPACIFLDINIPVMDGVTLLRKLKSDPLLSEIPVIMYSTTNNPVEIDSCLRIGARRFITKNISYQKLVQTLKDIKDEILPR